MKNLPKLQRRHVLTGLAGLALAGPAQAQLANLQLGGGGDQTAALQAALDEAITTGRVQLPPGRFSISNLRIPANLVIEGVPGATALIATGTTVASISGARHVVLRDITFAGNTGSDPLLDIVNSENVTIERCLFSDNATTAINITGSDARIQDCRFSGHGDAAIHALDNLALLISGNTISRCGNAGIRVWRSEEGKDGTIVINNRISAIDWIGGGNGQNGNGVNVFRADEVIVADNHISDCAFTAIRLNTTRNTQISGNQCHGCGEVAIFSEFAFSGSVIANNVVDGAAAGISMTNLDSGGQIAVCSGNIVRNISPTSLVNPDASPYGIAAEADAAVTGNVVENCPGVAFIAGWGPYLRNVAIANNVVVTSAIGIAVSVADGVGAVTITGNRIDATEHEIVGMLWTEMAEPDLRAAADRYPHVTLD